MEIAMMKTYYYMVAGHRFAVHGSEQTETMMENYKPFVVEGGDTLFDLTVRKGERVSYDEEMRQEDEGQDIICGRTAEGSPVFEFRWAERTAGWLVCDADYRQATLTVSDYAEKMAVDNALMVLYALATAGEQTALFHSSTVSYQGRAYMFLGKSGTGKSTHSGLWLKHIEGTELVNDDNPVVRLVDGEARVYGSPWSGKTPCYRNVSYPVGGIVQLSQAPYNKIQRLQGIKAYAALVPSISGMRWDSQIANGLHQTENLLAGRVAMWHLECLPDEAAARLCNETIAK